MNSSLGPARVVSVSPSSVARQWPYLTFINAPYSFGGTRYPVSLLRSRLPRHIFVEMEYIVSLLQPISATLRKELLVRIGIVQRELDDFVAVHCCGMPVPEPKQTQTTQASLRSSGPRGRRELSPMGKLLNRGERMKGCEAGTQTEESQAGRQTLSQLLRVPPKKTEHSFLLRLQREDSDRFEFFVPTQGPFKSRLDASVAFPGDPISQASIPRVSQSLISSRPADPTRKDRSRLFNRSVSQASRSKSLRSLLRALPFEDLGARSGISVHPAPSDDASIISRVKKFLKPEDIEFLESLKDLPHEELGVKNPFQPSRPQSGYLPPCPQFGSVKLLELESRFRLKHTSSKGFACGEFVSSESSVDAK